MLHIIGTIIIGFVAGVIAKLVTPGDKEPQGFILTTILGIGDLSRAGHWLVWAESECGLYRSYRGSSAHTVGLGIY